MRFLADLHLHSRYSRATSRDLTLPTIDAWARRKGITVVGTGDITHPMWLSELKEQLVPAEQGLFALRSELAGENAAQVPPSCKGAVRFVLQGEVSSIYKAGGAVRKIHTLVYFADFDAAEIFARRLGRLGNIASDGRPIVGASARTVAELCLEGGGGGRIIPAHVWTPWFSLFGSRSGFDSVEECFGDLSKEIFAVETGLSSDPPMNWRCSLLDSYSLVSSSDAHSPSKLGREASEFDAELSFDGIFGSLGAGASPRTGSAGEVPESSESRRKGGPGLLGTLEFFPENGKYHEDGHRKCGIQLRPDQTREVGGICPECGKKLTVGVLHRVEDLADRKPGLRPAGAREFESLIALNEIVADALGMGSATATVARTCEPLFQELGPELFVLRKAPLKDIESVSGPLIAEGVRRVRNKEVRISAGYDGEFGKVSIFDPAERAR